MGTQVKFDYSLTNGIVSEDEIKSMAKIAKDAKDVLVSKSGAGNDFLGWIDLPVDYDKEEFARIQKAAEKIKSDSEVLLVIGIGGSYLGARAAIEFLRHGFYNSVSKEIRKTPEIYYCGNSLSGTYLSQLIEVIGDRDFSVNIISKSGTTTEPAVAFRIFKEMLEKKYGKEEAAKRIYATTDKVKGALKNLSTEEGYETFVVPDDIGGRYSVLTAVGLFPIAMAGIDIDEMLKGAKDAMVKYNDSNIETNDAYRYGVARQLLNKAGYSAEMFVTYELQLNNVAEWWKQLYGESEGKENKGILPHSAVFSTDLHSLGQFIQEGSKVLYETIFEVKNPQEDMIIPSDPDDLDGLNYLAGKSVDYVNKKACEGTIDAHVNTGNVPNIIISLDKMDAYGFGYMVYFFEMSCAMSVYFLGVNPFNQPGVEVYKKNMFKLLGKPGY